MQMIMHLKNNELFTTVIPTHRTGTQNFQRHIYLTGLHSLFLRKKKMLVIFLVFLKLRLY